MKQHKEFILDDKCSYLANKTQRMHYRVLHNCSIEESQAYIEHGYRRFGNMYFQPICIECQECQSIKIDVKKYTFSKSQRRVIKKASNIEIIIQQPTLTKEHLNLFEKYHLHMHHKKGWNYNPTSADHYYNSFVVGHQDYGYEILYFLNKKLIGVDLVDIYQNGISAIYFYYDPEYAYLSLGKYSLLNQIKLAKELNKEWIYLGYYVDGCPSLEYKADYKPYVTLEGRPLLQESAVWC